MALLLRIAGSFQQRPPVYAVRINVTWDRSWTQNLLQSTLTPVFLPPGKTTLDLPPLGPVQPLRSWTWNYNLNLIAQDRFPPGETVYDRPPLGPIQPLRSWTWSYNLNLIGKDALPIGTIVYALPTQAWAWTDRTWTQPLNLNLLTAPKPFFQSYWPLTPDYQRTTPSWTASFNLNLIGKDQLPVGEQITDLPPRAYPEPATRTWIGLPVPPAPPIAIPRAPLYAPRNELTWYRDWSQNFVIRQVVTVKPFNQQDWPNPTIAAQPIRSWTWNYNLNLIGQDQLPIGDRITDGSPGPLQPLRSWTWQYNLNLIAQDALPVGKQVYDLAPTGYIYPNDLRTWINRVNLALTTQAAVLPFNQYDWPNPYGPKQPDRTWVWNYNLNLIGKDQLPTGKQVTDLPPKAYPEPATRTWTFAFNNNLIGKDQLPVGKQVTDLPPRDYNRPIQLRSWTYSYNLNLIGKDRLPVGDIIYDLPPRAHTYPNDIRTYTKGLNLPIIVPPVKLPFNQYDWPNPGAWLLPIIDRAWVSQRNLNLFPFVSPIPPVPPPTPPNTVEARPVRDFWDRDEWGNFIPGAGIRGT